RKLISNFVLCCYLSPPFLYELPPTSPVTKQTNSQIEKKKEKKNKKPQIMDSQKPSTVGKPIRCKAAVCRVAGEPLVMEEITVATPRAHEARIRIVCTSLCHSDITFWKMKEFPGITPRILGHEAIGIVESVGEEVIKLEVGDTVIPVFLSDCAECSDCRSKKSNLCTKFPFQISPWMPRDGTSRFTDLDGNIIHHFLSVSSFSEYTVVDVAHLTKIYATVPMNIACLLSCGVSTGVGAAWRTADVEEGSTVAIFGLGSIGLAVAEGARIRGAGRIIGVDMKPDKFEIGEKISLHVFLISLIEVSKLNQVINEITAGGADYCFECVGLPSLMEEAYACCRKGWGKTIVLGVARPMSEIKLQCFEVLHSGKILTGSLFGGLKPKSDIPILLKHYMNKELELDKFVTHEMDFKDINTAFDLLIKGESLRCVMWMNR
ncbi:Alcohol dehydrogenase-like 7, partial [Linum perenne]